jgi:hypothetical protein
MSSFIHTQTHDPSKVTLSSSVAHEHLVQLLDVFAQGESQLVIVVSPNQIP